MTEEFVPTASASIVVHERPPDELSAYVEQPDGTEVRIAGDEPNAPLSDVSTASGLNGGYTTADGTFLSPRDVAPFVSRHAGVTFRLPDRERAWEGRLEAIPDKAESGELKLAAMGHQALLEDAPIVTFLGVDADLSGWEEAPRERRKTQHNTPNSRSINGAFSPSVDEGGMSITMDPDRNVQISAAGELWYLGSEGKRLAEIQYIASEVNGSGMLASIRSFDAFDTSADDSEALVTTLAVTSWVPDDPCKYLVFRDTPTGSAANKPNRLVEIHAASVFGNHGLTRQPIDGLPDGLFPSDALAYLIERKVPMLTVGEIETSTIAVPDMKWLDPVSMGEILNELVALEHGRFWAVWGDRTLTYRNRQDVGRTWTLRRSEGARFISSGESSEPDVNCVIVRYTENGKEKWAGPVDSGADTEDASLRDTDSSSPVNASRVVGDRYLDIDAGECTSNKAIELGAQALQEALRRRFIGEVEVPRYAWCEGVLQPSVLMRADDWIVDGDALEYDPMPLSAVNYTRSRGDRPAQATIDLPANRLDVALARQGVRPGRVRRAKIRKRNRRLRKAHRPKRWNKTAVGPGGGTGSGRA